MSQSINCKYHPEKFAGWHCSHCNIAFCIDCVTDPVADLFPSCNLCRRSLDSLSIAKQVPLLRLELPRLLLSLLSVQRMLFIVALSLLFAVTPDSRMGDTLSLLLTIPLFISAFSLMEKSANNELPVFKFGILVKRENRSLFFKFALFLFLTITFLTKLGGIFSATFANLVLALAVFSVPASLVIILMERSVLSPLNLKKILVIIGLFRTDYLLLLLGVCLSVFFALYPTVIAEVEFDSTLKSVLFYVLSFTFLQLFFLMMGQLIYQHHVELNYNVRGTNRGALKTNLASQLVEAEMFIQEGRFEDAEKILLVNIQENKEDFASYQKLIFVYSFQEKNSFRDRFCEEYFCELKKREKFLKAADFYCDLWDKEIEFRPNDPSIAIWLANSMTYQQRDNALGLLSHYGSKPNTIPMWDNVSLTKARVLYEYYERYDEAKELLDVIIRRSFDQSILDEAEKHLVDIEEKL
ncbi:MAG: hypothetical protein KUG78_05025 [Kangiellaceae bacterium]|nr:hypothetical protein [Kangiellaceae bacterium]